MLNEKVVGIKNIYRFFFFISINCFVTFRDIIEKKSGSLVLIQIDV